uniref:Small integral membrane protein 13 n=2 Tax=Ursus TaxID=9639 RepID=A0A452UV79_URSMA
MKVSALLTQLTKIHLWHGSGSIQCWYFVWHLFLSKFKFLRELVGDTGSQEGDHEPSGSETEEDTSSSSHRIRSARQRRAPADEGH